jgi:rhomboid-like protein
MRPITTLLTILAFNPAAARHPLVPTQKKLPKLRGGHIFEQNPTYQSSPTLGDVDTNGYYKSTSFAIPNNRKPPPITKLIYDYFSSLYKFSPTLSYGTYTSLILFVLWQFTSTSHQMNQVLQRHFVCNRRNIKQRRYHTLFTSSFSHASLHHLAVNLYAFLSFGPSVANVLSAQSVDLWPFVVSAALFGSLTFLALDKRGMGSCIGLSGVTLALLAFDSLVYPSKELRMIVSFIPIHLPAYYLYLGLLGFSILGVLGLVGGRSNVAHSTHLGGLVFGHCFYEAFRRGWIRRWNYQIRRVLQHR